MKKKRTDIFIYTAAIVSCVIMIVLLTTSSSISYGLYDEIKPGDNSQSGLIKTPKINSQPLVTAPSLPDLHSNVEDIISNITKPSTSRQEASSDIPNVRSVDKKSAPDDMTEDGNEVDKLIIDILLNNQSALHSQSKKERPDSVLDVYQNENLSQNCKQPEQKENQVYIVRRGDCLYNIALAHGMTSEKLASLNGILNPNLIFEGQKLVYETSVQKQTQDNYLVYHIQKDDTIQKIAERYKLDRDSIIRINDLNDEKVHAGQTLYLPYRLAHNLAQTPMTLKSYIWPLPVCSISSPYGMRPDPMSPNHEMSFHPGLDLSAALGDRIRAVQDGKVVFAGRKNGYGNMIIISHPDGYMSVYAHAQLIFVKAGQTVTQGQIIARVGSSGKSTGPHLHFELRKYARSIDPRSVITALRR